MRKRTDIIEMFSTFIDVDGNSSYYSLDWAEPRPDLLVSIRNKVKETPNADEEFWAKFWLKEVLKNPENSLARSHISAYLEQICYSVVIAVSRQFPNINLSHTDCFLIARGEAANSAKIFKNYDFKSSKVKTYARFPIKGSIINEIYEGKKILTYTLPGLLRLVTKKKLQKSLQKAGIEAAEIARFTLVWQCFREIYVPTRAAGSQQLQPPSLEQLQAVARRYNQITNNSATVATSVEIQEILDRCYHAIRNSVIINVVALDDDNCPPSYFSNEVLEEEIADIENTTEEWLKIKTVLSDEFNTLPLEIQRLIKLAYGLNFIQNEIGQIFNIKQFQISRNKNRGIKKLLDKLLTLLERDYQIIIDSDSKINEISKNLEFWLNAFCGKSFKDFLQIALVNFFNLEILLLRLLFGERLTVDKVAQKLQITESEVSDRINQVETKLQIALKAWLQFTLQVDFSSINNSADKRIATFVREWLETVKYASLEINNSADEQIITFIREWI